VLQQDENNELVASETDAFAIADFINVSPLCFVSQINCKFDISLYHACEFVILSVNICNRGASVEDVHINDV
jgi:hypothetical protein